MTPDRQNEPGEPGLAVAGWRAGSFTISTASGGVVAVALAFTDWIAALTNWGTQEISATPELREQVRKAFLSRTHKDFHAGRLPSGPEKA
jgi:hypothetical protein